MCDYRAVPSWRLVSVSDPALRLVMAQVQPGVDQVDAELRTGVGRFPPYVANCRVRRLTCAHAAGVVDVVSEGQESRLARGSSNLEAAVVADLQSCYVISAARC
jgi:hypothetical protein